MAGLTHNLLLSWVHVLVQILLLRLACCRVLVLQVSRINGDISNQIINMMWIPKMVNHTYRLFKLELAAGHQQTLETRLLVSGSDRSIGGWERTDQRFVFAQLADLSLCTTSKQGG